jgi:hypothetical protein
VLLHPADGRNGLLELNAVRVQVIRPEPRGERVLLRPDLADRVQRLEVEPGAVLQTAAVLVGALVGQAYAGTVTVSGGSGSCTWAASGLPAGLAAASSGGTLTISGTPAQSGDFPVSVSLTVNPGVIVTPSP